MISKKIVAVGLSVVLSTLLFGETKPKKQIVQMKPTTEQPKSEVIQKDPNEYEVSKSDVMPKITPPLIRDNKTQTVYDPTTKLIWQDNTKYRYSRQIGATREWQLMNIKDGQDSFRWQTRDKYDNKDYDNTEGDTATTYCKNLRLGGYNDWRLPTVPEMMSIINFDGPNFGFNLEFKNQVTNSSHCTSDTNPNDKSQVWMVFNSGPSSYPKDQGCYVRCVRNSK